MEIILLILIGVPMGILVARFVRKVFFGEEFICGFEYVCPNCGERFICRVTYNRFRVWEQAFDDIVRTCPNCGKTDLCHRVED